MRPNVIYEKSSELTYHKKEEEADMPAYNMVLNAMKKLDTQYNQTMKKMK